MNYYTPKHPELITARGNPNKITLGGQINEVVHLRRPKLRGGTNEDYPACYNGSYNLYWTRERKAVTCPVCLEKIS
jgi:hypothetical protein